MECNFPPIELHTKLKISDLYEVYLAQRLWKMLYGRMALALVLVAFFAIWEGTIEFLRPLLEPPLLYVEIIVLLYSIFFRPYLFSRAVIRTSGGRNYAHSYVFSDEGVVVRREHYEAHYDWAAIRRAKQTAHLLVLYTDSSLAIIVPKRCFANPQQLKEFRTILTEKVKRRNTFSVSQGQTK